jgi:hypothetical protein
MPPAAGSALLLRRRSKKPSGILRVPFQPAAWPMLLRASPEPRELPLRSESAPKSTFRSPVKPESFLPREALGQQVPAQRSRCTTGSRTVLPGAMDASVLPPRFSSPSSRSPLFGSTEAPPATPTWPASFRSEQGKSIRKIKVRQLGPVEYAFFGSLVNNLSGSGRLYGAKKAPGGRTVQWPLRD